MLRITSWVSCVRLVALATLFTVLAGGAGVAGSDRAWTVEQSSGPVRFVKAGITPIALTAGDTFSAGEWIETGPDGRAVLRRGEETIVVAPNSRIGLPKENKGPFATRILQTLGTILLTVEKKASQHFVVETPYLAAVVKGTTFTVGLRGERAVVHVIEGLVEVRDLASGQSGLVRPGQTGMVLSRSGSGVSVQGGNRGTDAPGSAGTQNVPVAPSEAAGPPAGQTADFADSGGSIQSRSTGPVVIRETLGPVKVDLSNTTGGLIREARATTAARHLSVAGATGDNGQTPSLTAASAASRASLGAGSDALLGETSLDAGQVTLNDASAFTSPTASALSITDTGGSLSSAATSPSLDTAVVAGTSDSVLADATSPSGPLGGGNSQGGGGNSQGGDGNSQGGNGNSQGQNQQ